MVVQGVDQVQVTAQLKVKVKKGPHRQWLLMKVLGQRTGSLDQGLHKLVRCGVQHGIGWRSFNHHRLGRLHQALQRRPHGSRRRQRGRAQLAQAQFAAVHRPGTLHQVVGLVNQHRQAPVHGLHQAPQLALHVQQVVDIAHHHVAPAHQFLPQVKRANAMAQGHLALRCRVQPTQRHRFVARRRQAVEKATGQGAGVAVAGFVRVLAGLLLGHHQHHPKGLARGRAAQLGQGFQGRDPAGALAGQESQFVDTLPWHGAQRGKQRAQGFADAGGGLCQQAAAVHGAAVNGFGQLALAAAKRQAGKTKLRQRGVALQPVLGFLLGPGHEVRTALDQGVFQLGRTAQLLQLGLGLRGHVKVHQRQRYLRQLAAATEQRAIGLQLRPVQLAPVFRDVIRAPANGLDLFQAAVTRVVAVGTAAHAQRADLPFQRHFSFVVLPAAAGHQALAAQAFLCGGRRREAPVEVAALGGELAQRAHRHRVAPVQAAVRGKPCRPGRPGRPGRPVRPWLVHRFVNQLVKRFDHQFDHLFDHHRSPCRSSKARHTACAVGKSNTRHVVVACA